MGVAHLAHGVEQQRHGALGHGVALDERGDGGEDAPGGVAGLDVDVVVADAVAGKQQQVGLVLEELRVEERGHRGDDDVVILQRLGELGAVGVTRHADALDGADLLKTLHLIGKARAERGGVDDGDLIVHALRTLPFSVRIESLRMSLGYLPHLASAEARETFSEDGIFWK